jgi:hypothetical protein
MSDMDRGASGRREKHRARPGLLLLTLFAVAASAVGCGDDGIRAGSNINLELRGMRALDPITEGTLEAWVTDASGVTVSAGRFDIPEAGHVLLPNPVGDPREVFVTIEPPDDEDASPSDVMLLGGPFDRGVAELRIDGYVTAGPPLSEEIGSHVLFTPANNVWEGYPSDEDGGIWIFNIYSTIDPMRRDGLDLTDEFYLRVTPLTDSWTYEGWVVLDYGTPDECWISYGKMVPGVASRLNRQDNTGFGPFSGYIDYVGNQLAIENNFPGDDWVENPLNLPVPCGLEIPFDLNGDSSAGIPSRWTHVISIEQMSDLALESPEVGPAAPLTAKPFLIQPYRNPIGEGPQEEARIINYDGSRVPAGTARLWG